MNLQRCEDSSTDTKESVTDQVTRINPTVQVAGRRLIGTNINIEFNLHLFKILLCWYMFVVKSQSHMCGPIGPPPVT